MYKKRRFGKENLFENFHRPASQRDLTPLDSIDFLDITLSRREIKETSENLAHETGKVEWSYIDAEDNVVKYIPEFSDLLEQLYKHRGEEYKRQPYFSQFHGSALVDVHNLTHTKLDTGEVFKVQREVFPLNFIQRMFASTGFERTLADDMLFYIFGKCNGLEPLGQSKEYIMGPDDDSRMDSRLVFSSQCGNKRINQDNLCICTTNNGLLCAGVFDGHGPEGHLVSQMAAEVSLQEIRKFESKRLQAGHINEFFSEIDRRVCNHTAISSLLSGTTASFLMLDGSTFWFSHIGDSSIVLIREDESETTDWIGEKISKDHRPDVSSERERIIKEGGQVLDYAGTARVFLKDTSGVDALLEKSKRSRDDMILVTERLDLLPGLSLSRAIGDELGKLGGISANPEIFSCELKAPYIGALLASDGLWDAFDDPQDAIDLLHRYVTAEKLTREEALHNISRHCRSVYLSNGKSVDDITILWIAIETAGAAKLAKTTTAQTAEEENELYDVDLS